MAVRPFVVAPKDYAPVLNIVGEHATAHLKVDAPLTSDIQAFARTVSKHVRTVTTTDDVGPAAAESIAVAWGPPGEVATLIVPYLIWTNREERRS